MIASSKLANSIIYDLYQKSCLIKTSKNQQDYKVKICKECYISFRIFRIVRKI